MFQTAEGSEDTENILYVRGSEPSILFGEDQYLCGLGVFGGRFLRITNLRKSGATTHSD